MKLMHFTAEWCGPCKMMKPIIDEVVAERDDLDYVSIDIDQNQSTARDWEIMSVPTFILMDDDNNMLNRFSGGMPKNKFLEQLGI